ncbi:hypothetical protein XBKQ1_2930003 [Xenorhabdus bovienii str. kraussei Quebec]|uniref:Uncharacterized protein n=1 Tax=Xenorhabdus bovienii str. kraussei Quebec TaxID=1398203 RepID=A0A077PKG5_XENBV|nr:hypothetical protein XBKQ1_2930003 [Xenorhabdus bovienii str. kraussei Quebec]
MLIFIIPGDFYQIKNINNPKIFYYIIKEINYVFEQKRHSVN